MRRVSRAWGAAGFVAVLAGVGALAVGISAAAVAAHWAWPTMTAGGVFVVFGGVAMVMVSLGRRRSAWDDRGQRDPVLGEELSPKEEGAYLRRYRGRFGRRARISGYDKRSRVGTDSEGRDRR